jgi:hypothetical protein
MTDRSGDGKHGLLPFGIWKKDIWKNLTRSCLKRVVETGPSRAFTLAYLGGPPLSGCATSISTGRQARVRR